MCQDTGTAIVMGKRGELVLTGGDDERSLSLGIEQTYETSNLRFSQMAPLTMWDEKNTGTNLPAQIELYATPGNAYKLLFMAKGGGSANKSYLYQETKAVLNRSSMLKFLDEKLRTLGTSACPPYHLAVVVGGTSAEFALKTAKYASAHYLDSLPTEGSALGHGFRDLELEQDILALTQGFGIGAQFGGKYFCHDVRVIRLPRHGASCPVAVAVSCSADRQALGKITGEGVFLEQLEEDPASYLPEVTHDDLAEAPTSSASTSTGRWTRSAPSSPRYPVKTRLSLTGPMVVARDIAHAKIKERLDAGEPMPQYLRDHCVYYAGPAKTPEGMASGSFGPTTAGRMDSYVQAFQAAGGSLVMLAKGNRSRQVTDACAAHGGFYLGSIGGPAARLAQDCIRKVEVLEYPELGMEAVWKIEVEDFPAFIVVDDKGNDFFDLVSTPVRDQLGELDEVEVVVGPEVQRALRHHQDLVGREVADEVGVVAHEHDRARPVPQALGDGDPRAGVEVVGGLVEEEQVVAAGHEDAEGELGLLAAGEGAGVLVDLVAGQPHRADDLAEHRVGTGRDLLAQVLHDRAAGVDALVLLRVVAGDHVVADDDLALVGLAVAGQHPQQRGLAGAVEPHDQQALAALDEQVDVTEHLVVAVAHGQPGALEHRATRRGRRREPDGDLAVGLAGRDPVGLDAGDALLDAVRHRGLATPSPRSGRRRSAAGRPPSPGAAPPSRCGPRRPGGR